MTKLFHHLILLALTLPLLGGCTDEDRDNADKTTLVRIGQLAPDFTLPLYPEGEITLSSLRGKIVLLTFWDPECPMCRDEIAVVEERIINRFSAENFQYLPVARGAELTPLRGFCIANNYHFPIAADSQRQAYGLYATMYVPRSFIIDEKGYIRSISVEYELEHLDEIAAKIEQMLK